VVRDLFLAYLAQHDDERWLRVVDRIAASIHPVDRAAVRIWLHFYPLALDRLMARPDAAVLARRMTLAGRWRLAEQAETSHAFLYGHRYWPKACRAALEHADAPVPPGSLDLGAQIHHIAGRAAAAADAEPALLVGIAAIALRTLQQAGPEALVRGMATAATGDSRRPDDVMRARARGPAAGWRARVGLGRQLYVVFDERREDARVPIVASQHVATAAALDTRPYRERDPRCSEGPIPVHCRSCSCGTCWIGILSGAGTLSPIDGRERDKLRECGVAVEGSHPEIRLACMAQAGGPLTIVIPPWNGLLGRALTTAG
jgi:ferredoxin